MDFIIGGTAAMCATVFSNPFDVIKTRQQLFGELQKQNSLKNNLKDKNPYKGVFRSAKTIIKADGLLGLQKGLGSALCFQFILNSSRLGIYETGENFGLTKNKNGENSPIFCVLLGGFSGIVGAALGCPLLMIKTQMQSKSHGKFAVGDQHQHKGTIQALNSIYKESGIKGLWRGYTASVPRTALMSSIQLSAFTKSKDYLRNYEVFGNSNVLISIGSGMISGLVACCTMSPLDVITTRLFNQAVDSNGRGLKYKNIFDCFLKIVKREGIAGLYKGFLPYYWRTAPHIVLNLTFWEQLKKLKNFYYQENKVI